VTGWAAEIGRGLPADLVVAVVRLAATGVSADRLARAVQPRLNDHSVDACGVAAALTSELGSRLASAVETDAVGGRLAKLQARVAIVGFDGYPPRLADAWPELGAPLWIFLRGAGIPEAPTAAIVGTRKPTLEGLATAAAISRRVAKAGGVVVSGMARGIDQAAHSGALDGGGPTVAVLGAGFDVDYPAGNTSLRRAIMATGALVTEFHPATRPAGHRFLERNRIVSGLADVTVVVEGRERSGSLHTARLAVSQGREVLAVPGPVRAPTSRAPLDLIRDGATPLTRLDDVVEALGLAAADAADDPNAARLGRLSPAAQAILPLLSAVPATAGGLAAASGEAVPRVLAAITELTAAGFAVSVPRGVVRAAVT
jgi:DNA processing protein